MGKAAELRDVPIAELKPYERNAKQHGQEQIDKIARSMQELGFISPCLIDREMNVIAGHGRIMAAKQIGWDAVPCVFIEGLTETQRRAYILEDNRLAELSDWDMEKVAAEMKDLFAQGYDVSSLDFDIDGFEMEEINFDETTVESAGTGGEKKKGKPWKTSGVRCDMKPAITAREKDGHRYISLYASSKEGQTLEEIKNNRKCEKQMAEEMAAYIRESMGSNLAESGWGMLTTGRRRHREGYHFATAVSKSAAEKLGLPFYEGAVRCENSNRLKPELKLERKPTEKNLILFDDIITTGTTMARTVDLLRENGYTVMTIIGIRNQ